MASDAVPPEKEKKRRMCSCSESNCRNCSGTHLALSTVQAKKEGKCINCFYNRLPGTKSSRNDAPERQEGGHAKARRKDEQARARAAAEQPSLDTFLRGGAEAPSLWQVAPDDVDKQLVSLSNLYLQPAVATSGRVQEILGKDTLCTVRTFGTMQEPECGFNAILGRPSTVGSPLRLPDCRRLMVSNMNRYRAEFETIMEEIWHNGPVNARQLIFQNRQPPPRARLDEHAEDLIEQTWVRNDDNWQGYCNALRHINYELSQSEVLLIAALHGISARVWVCSKGVILSVQQWDGDGASTMPSIDIVLSAGHYERPGLKTSLTDSPMFCVWVIKLMEPDSHAIRHWFRDCLGTPWRGYRGPSQNRSIIRRT